MTLGEGRADDVRLATEGETLVDDAATLTPRRPRRLSKRAVDSVRWGVPATPADGKDARGMAELTNAIQKFFIENSRLGIPVIFHEECLHGHVAIGRHQLPAADRPGGDLQSGAWSKRFSR